MFLINKMTNKEEYQFFLEMFYESIHILENKPSKEELLNAPNLRKYHEGWGRKGDCALLATNAEKTPIGAAWYRLFDEKNKGYGYFNEKTPEIGIAVLNESRGKGVGMLLMRSIMQHAKEEGYPGISLSVDLENKAAIELYEKLGFRDYETVGTSKTMVYEY
ncbi:GNAT family N-acetyltransferase [Sporosarcina sp. Te-1]|uniref:GNAT family N-acetyltransferase n=1 Tax=Sporosarcina sp. Te-1 TaxID=2818390 RepID=UPI001A9F1795|nr:GNAT family N-acetyltransferase [Sporosarcina sp. Te-1]QTD42531.1 GNAT family N-acetyltransferase [Sporosarcina sp. Te-1]